jgi:hypothetical protein
MLSIKKLGTAIVAVSALTGLFGTGSASAANWDPPNTTLTAHGNLTIDWNVGNVACTYHSGLRSAGGADAFTTETNGTVPAPPTFSNCTSSLGTIVSVTNPAAWTLTATTTTAVDMTFGLSIVMSVLGINCTIAAHDVTIPMTWNNVAKTITPGATSYPTTTTGGAFCPSITSSRLTGTVIVPGLNLT